MNENLNDPANDIAQADIDCVELKLRRLGLGVGEYAVLLDVVSKDREALAGLQLVLDIAYDT